MSIRSCTSLANLTKNGWVLFAARAVRMFAFGCVGVILALYLSALGLSDEKIGQLLFLNLLGDAVISLVVTLSADRVGRRKMLLLGCTLKLVGAASYASIYEANFWLLAAAGTIGVISPSGNEVGPFMALEQSVLSDLVKPADRTMVFVWYNVLGYFATACGSFVTGFMTTSLVNDHGLSALAAYRSVFVEYGGLSLLLIGLTLMLSDQVELQAGSRQASPAAAAKQPAREDRDKDEESDEESGDKAPLLLHLEVSQAGAAAKASAAAAAPAGSQADQLVLGLSRKSRGIVLHLSLLFAADSFGGSLVTGTLLAYYFQVTYGVSDAYLGGLLFGANIIAGISSLAAGWVAARIGLVKTMVFTHLPSNVLLIMIPLMPNLHSATAMLFLRSCVSQMDVAPRQSFVSGIVLAEERTATMGIVNVVKSLATSFGPLLTGWLASQQLFRWAFFLAGGIKILYDLALLWSFRHLRADHEDPAKS